MFEIIDLEQRTEAWTLFRQKHLGSSDANAILGVSPWKSAYQLWLEKTNLDVIGKNYVSYQMQRGIDLEAKALECFNGYMGDFYRPCVVKSTQYPWMIASLDGMSDHLRICEIKCPGWEDHFIAVNGKVPDKYIPQLMHQMACTGAKEMHYFSFDGEDGVIVKVDRDEEYISDLIAKEKEFWECVQELREPKQNFIERNDDEWYSLASQYKAVQGIILPLLREQERLKASLITATNGNNSKGNGLSLTKITRKGCIDYSQVPELKNVNLDQYRKPSTEYWKLEDVK